MAEPRASHGPHAHGGGGEIIPFPGRPIGADDDPTVVVPEAEPLPPVAEPEIVDAEIVHDGQGVGRVDAEVDRWKPEGIGWAAGLAERKRTARPIVPAYLRSSSDAAQLARWVAGYYGHVAAYHATRSPLYLLRLLGRAPRGAGRVVGAYGRWVTDAEARPLLREAAGREVQVSLSEGTIGARGGDAQRYLMLSTRHDARVRARVILSLVLLPVLVTVGAVSVAVAGAWLSGLAAGVALGLLGRRPDAPIIDRAVTPTSVAKLTSDHVLRALGALGISEVTKAVQGKGKGGAEIAFVSPITRDGPGWRAEVDLPFGVVATDVMERRDRLASGLRRPLGCVWPEPVTHEHTGRLVLWVGDEPMEKAKQAPWPLAKAEAGTADIFSPIPFGADQRGRPIGVPLIFEGVLIGAKPRMGKTFALRVLLLGAALDPRVEIRIFELKGTGDCGPLERVAHEYASGADDETIGQALASLRQVATVELVKRAETIKRVAKESPERCPENKVTPDLSADRALGLHPLLFGVDECQELFSHPEYGKEAKMLATAIVKRGPALGIIPILATQRPDADSLPTGVASSIGVRFCLRVMGQTENDMVLGTSAYKNGIRATTFTKHDRGIGYLAGVDDDALVVRSAYIDGPMSETIADRARALRIAAGRLTGHAAGEDTAASHDTSTVVDHLVAVWPEGADRVHSHRLVDALAAYMPAVYGAWTEEEDVAQRSATLSAALKPHGVKTEQLTIRECCGGAKGVRWAAVEKVMDARK